MVSDIHLEHHDKHDTGAIVPEMFLRPSAPLLALCGDIGNPWRRAYKVFLDWCSAHFESVFLVAGNHEYHSNHSIAETDAQIETICKEFSNVFFLQKKAVQTPYGTVLGCTLWSNILAKEREAVERRIADFVRIPNCTVEYVRKRHRDHASWLEAQLQHSAAHLEPTFVLTHHLPSYFLLDSTYSETGINSAFATDLEHLATPQLEAWFCGHTHRAVHACVKGAHFVVNPFGYPLENRKHNLRKVVMCESRDPTNAPPPPIQPSPKPPLFPMRKLSDVEFV